MSLMSEGTSIGCCAIFIGIALICIEYRSIGLGCGSI
jgi:hypothetical protein